ncbi:MAG: helix-hairpin-helix domain-containing protein [Pseudomonadales bacterium]
MNKLIRQISRLGVLAVALYAGLVFAAPTSVNANRADAQTIAEVLKGVGLRRAQAIVAYREENGEFRDVYELSNIKGIGERTVERNEAKIRLKD